MHTNAGLCTPIVRTIIRRHREHHIIDVPHELMETVRAALRRAGLGLEEYERRGVTRYLVRYCSDVPDTAYVPTYLRFNGVNGDEGKTSKRRKL